MKKPENQEQQVIEPIKIPEELQEHKTQEPAPQMSPEDVQKYHESLHNDATYRVEKLLQKEEQWKEAQEIILSFGSNLFQRLDRIAIAIENLKKE